MERKKEQLTRWRIIESSADASRLHVSAESAGSNHEGDFMAKGQDTGMKLVNEIVKEHPRKQHH